MHNLPFSTLRQQKCDFDGNTAYGKGDYTCGHVFNLCRYHYDKWNYCPEKDNGHWRYWFLRGNITRYKVKYTCGHRVDMSESDFKKYRNCPILNDGGEKVILEY